MNNEKRFLDVKEKIFLGLLQELNHELIELMN